MGVFLGGVLGLGLLLVATSLRAPPREPRSRDGLWRTRAGRTRELLAAADLAGWTPGRLALVSAGVGALTGGLVGSVSHAWPVATAFAVFAAAGPRALVRRRARNRAAQLRGLWPDLVDDLASAVRAGLALPEGLAALGTRGPEGLRAPFRRFAEGYRATGSFPDCLDRLAADLADPVGDRVIEALRIARDVGGADLGTLLRTLSGFLREEARTRAELEARAGWTVNAARLAAAAPWVVLLLLATQPSTVAAYDSRAGVLLLLVGGGLCWVCYRLMRAIGRLPEEPRVLR